MNKDFESDKPNVRLDQPYDLEAGAKENRTEP